ncbi:NAD-dependent epimerase/dehydratase family protein [Occallatibacter savannae]|uniref:NAD-dependent epimerase/dehydratase family protein n=1 Tax=Occallatibacter savannae TaxID=1002691 RepID=UPI000D697C6F|nr:NAD-dependent epimerase/dehydratase family protein [Occallatibacter savannae]
MYTILGAGGSVSNELVKLLAARKLPFRTVSRHASAPPGAADVRIADLTKHEQTVEAVAGSDVVFLLAGLKYDHKLWAEQWPRIIDNAVDACKQARAKLIFFDNVYMYGRVNGPMTEETPYNPASRKGAVRAQIARRLERAWKDGELTAMIARAADFYGPDAKNGIPNVMVFEPLRKGGKAMCLVSDAMPHSYTYVPDAAEALLKLAESPTAWNQTWHLPTAPQPLTGREFIQAAAQAMGKEPRYRVLSRTMVKMAGWFDATIREVHEMLYQNDSPYLFDSSKYARAFGFAGTPYAKGIEAAQGVGIRE